MKKSIFAGVFFSLLIFAIPADDLANCLQDLAMQTACLGVYSRAEVGANINSRYNDPPDWYKPSTMAQRFAAMSGNMTRTNTFYGVCFDYAQFAWDYIKRDRKKYNDAGMKDTQWYIAIAHAGNPNTIILYDPVSQQNSTYISNGVYLKEISRHNVYTHDGATGHAWLWVQHNNGTWYWIDPTWTDNTGYIWWGVVENGREVQRYPDPAYCVANNYPRPGGSNNGNNSGTNTGTRSSSATPSTTNTSYNRSNSSYLAIGFNYSSELPIGLTIANSMFFDKSLIYISANCNLEFDQIEWICGISIAVTNWLRIPIGIGANHTIRNANISSGSTWINGVLVKEHYQNSTEWENKFVIEIGLQPVIFDRYYFSATYRLIGFTRSGFSFGVGFFF